MYGSWRSLGAYGDGNVESGDEADDVQSQSVVTAAYTECGLVWKLSLGVALNFPRMAETNMGQANRRPDEEVGKTR